MQTLIDQAKAALSNSGSLGDVSFVDITPDTFASFKAIKVETHRRMNEWGRGLSTTEATLGAAMERVERVSAFLSSQQCQIIKTRPCEWRDRVIGLGDLGFANFHHLLMSDQTERFLTNHFVEAKSVLSDEKVLVPASRALLHYSDGMADSTCSTGLAAHFDRIESEERAIIEVIERHAHHVIKFARPPLRPLAKAPDTPRLKALLGDLDQHHIRVDVLSSDLVRPLNCIAVRLSNQALATTSPLKFSTAFQLSVHWDVATAIERAVTEALVSIVNSHRRRVSFRRNHFDRAFAAHFDECLGTSSAEPEHYIGSKKEAIASIATALNSEIFVVDLTFPAIGIPVIRALMTNVQPNFDLMGLGPFHFRARVTPHLPCYREAISRAEKGQLSTPELVSRVVTPALAIDQNQYDLLLSSVSSVKSPSLNVLLERRRSRRDFCGNISRTSLSKLLVEGLGLPRFLRGRPYAFEVRSYPSGGALFPIDVVVEVRNVTELPVGAYFYDPRRTRLIKLADHVWSAGQSPFFKAAAVLWMIYSRSVNAQKYGENAERLALIEAGHIGQNLLLVAESMDLNACPFLGQKDAPVVDLFESEAEAIYAIGVG